MNKFSRVLFVIAAIFSALFGTAGSSYASMAADAAPAAHAVSTLRVQADLSAHAAGCRAVGGRASQIGRQHPVRVFQHRHQCLRHGVLCGWLAR